MARIDIAAISPFRPFVLDKLREHFEVHDVIQSSDKVAALAPVAGRIRGIATGGLVGVPTAMIEALPNLEIGAINGVGLETTDLALARKRGIVITTAPVLFDDVADLAVLLGMAACRQLVLADRFVRAGRWGPERMPPARKFTGLNAGVIGMGRIGRAVARRLEGFAMTIRFADPFVQAERDYIRAENALELARQSDILFMTAAGGPKGDPPVVDAAILEALGSEGVFVNVARGWLVDQEAMVAMLQDGRLGAAGLDVFTQEPEVPAPLLALDNVVLSPHIASNTVQTMQAMGQNVIDNLVTHFNGQGALTPVP